MQLGSATFSPVVRTMKSTGGIGLLRFDGNGKLINIDTTIYTLDPAKPNVVVASHLPSIEATYTVKPNGTGEIRGFVGFPQDLNPPTIFIITRSQCGIAQELFIVLGAV